jgi:hypothetical protein
MAVRQLRKALGCPEDQPVPEAKMVQALTGKLGPQIQSQAQAVGAGGQYKPASPNGVPTTPDPGQAGGQASPPSPGAPDAGNSPPVQPGAQTQGAMPGAATIFGRPPVSAHGEQGPTQGAGNTMDEDEDQSAMTGARGIFRRR